VAGDQVNHPSEDLVLYYPEGHQRHYEFGHPERPERVEAIKKALTTAGWWGKYPKIKPAELPEDLLQTVHTPEYLEVLRSACRLGSHLDADTYTTTASWELALDAAGGAMAVVDHVWSQRARRGFALTRPPGHHATRARGMGFCLLNNVALAAAYLIQEKSASRLAIVDLDLHHGNGTQDIFYSRDDVFYISTHQSPLYPGTGGIMETGVGAGKGHTANFPMPPGSGDQAFKTILEEVVIKLLDRYQAEMLLVSYGFDPHWRDPLGHLKLSAAAYGQLISRLAAWADEHCQGRIALFLEGGYDLEAAAACSLAVTGALLAETVEDPLGPAPGEEGSSWQSLLEQAKNIWDL